MLKKTILFLEGIDSKEVDFERARNDGRIHYSDFVALVEKGQHYLTHVIFSKYAVDSIHQSELKSWINKMLLNIHLSKYMFMREDLHIVGTVGYSSGLITAMAISKLITLEEAIDLLVQCYMIGVSSREEYALVFECGVPIEMIHDFITVQEKTPYIYEAGTIAANIGLFSGVKSHLEDLHQMLIDSGAILSSVIPSPVPYHSPMAKSLIGPAEKAIENFTFSEASTPLYSIYESRILEKTSELRYEYVRNLYDCMPLDQFLTMIVDNNFCIAEVSLHHGFSKMCKSLNRKIQLI